MLKKKLLFSVRLYYPLYSLVTALGAIIPVVLVINFTESKNVMEEIKVATSMISALAGSFTAHYFFRFFFGAKCPKCGSECFQDFSEFFSLQPNIREYLKFRCSKCEHVDDTWALKESA